MLVWLEILWQKAQDWHSSNRMKPLSVGVVACQACKAGKCCTPLDQTTPLCISSISKEIHCFCIIILVILSAGDQGIRF